MNDLLKLLNQLVILEMASVGIAPTSGLREAGIHAVGVERLPEEMNDMKIRDDKVCASSKWLINNLVLLLWKSITCHVWLSLVFRQISFSL